MDEDFNSLQTETEAQRVALDKLHESSNAYFKAMSKLNPFGLGHQHPGL
jgi:hypothetical protein